MTEYLSDKEQVEQIKDWWKDNGVYIFSGVALGLIGIFGWRAYDGHLNQRSANASAIYEELNTAVINKQSDKAETLREQILSEYANTPYSTNAELLRAKEAVSNNDLDKAIESLKSADDLNGDAQLASLIQYRLAKVYFAKADYAESLTSLKKVDDSTYLGLVEELRGDIYAAQGNKEEAVAAYEKARIAMEETRIGDLNLLQMKLSDLGS